MNTLLNNRRQILMSMIGASAMLAGGRRAMARDLTIKVGFNKFSSNLQYHATKENGFFEAEGLTISDAFTPPPMAIPALMSGQYDVVFHTIQDIAQIHLKGSKVKIIHPGSILSEMYPYTRLVVPADSPITSAKEFEGKKIAMPLLRTTLDLDLFSWLEANGADRNKVSLVSVGIDGIVPALKSKQFDAAYVIEPAFTVIKSLGIGKALAFPPGAFGPNGYMATAYAANEDWVGRNPDAAKAFVRALNKGTQWLQSNSDKVAALVAKFTGIEEGLAHQMIMPGATQTVRSAEMQPLLDAAAKYGYVEKAIVPCDLLSSVCPKQC